MTAELSHGHKSLVVKEKQKGHETRAWNMTVKASKNNLLGLMCLISPWKHIRSNIVLKQSGLSIRCFRTGWLHCHECKHTYIVIVRVPSTRCDEPTGRCFCAQCVQNAVLNIPTVFIMFFVEQGLFWPQYLIIFSTILLDFYEKRVLKFWLSEETKWLPPQIVIHHMQKPCTKITIFMIINMININFSWKRWQVLPIQ